MDIDLKTLAPDSTIPAGAVLFGADSQAATQPSVYPLSDVVAVATATTASAANTFTADQVISKATPVLVLNKTASGQFLSLRGSTNGSLRWEMPLGNSTASGETSLSPPPATPLPVSNLSTLFLPSHDRENCWLPDR